MRGIDLESLFEDLPADRTMNALDTLLVDDAIAGSNVEGGIEKIRTKVLSVYNGSRARLDTSNMSNNTSYEVKPMHTYTELNDEGMFDGLEPPLG